MDLGADGSLTKPFDSRTLSDQVESIIRDAQAQ